MKSTALPARFYGDPAEVVDELHTLGARHIAYYPDDLFQDQPRLADFKAAFSMRSHPEQ